MNKHYNTCIYDNNMFIYLSVIFKILFNYRKYNLLLLMLKNVEYSIV